MRRLVTCGLALVGAVVTASPALATITLTPVAPLNATMTAHPYLMVDFRNADGSDFTLARATVIEKTFHTFGAASYDLVYEASDLLSNDGWPWDGIRIVELVTNNTPYTWTDYHIAFTAPPGTLYWQLWGSGATPGTYLVTGSGDSWTAQFAPSVGVVASPPGNQVDFYLQPGYEVTPGQSFGLYVAARPFDLSVAGTMRIVQYPTVSDPTIPEPTTLIIWSLLGTLAIGVGWWRKRKAA